MVGTGAGEHGNADRAAEARGELILVAEDEADIRRLIEMNLSLEGYDVAFAEDGEEALQQAFALRPALVLLDVMMPKVDGFEVCRRLRADSRTSHIPVILLTAKTLTVDKVLGLTAGADDYVMKPFEPVELIARVRTTLRRSRELRATSPLTGLPGNHVIGQEIADRLRAGEEVAVIYADLNDFKAYNDRYGFLRGDDVILLTADVLRQAVRTHADAMSFVGHIGGDDFMLACAPQDVKSLCEAIIEEFDRRIPALYDDEDLQRGHLDLQDRRGDVRSFPLVSIALGVATNTHREVVDHRELVAVATDMKSYLKRHHARSAFAVDGRVAGDAGPADGDGTPQTPQA